MKDYDLTKFANYKREIKDINIFGGSVRLIFLG